MNEDILPELEEYRKEIDECDQALIETLVRRFGVVKKVGILKKRTGMTAIQPVRAQAVKDAAVRLGQERGLDAEFIRRVYDALIDHAHDLEHEILDEADC